VMCVGLVLLRALSCLAYYLRCRHYFSLGRMRQALDVHVAKRLMSYGGWITISNLVSPIMAYLDRFLVAGAVSVAAAGYYSTSQEVVTRFQIIPTAILSVLFPAISRSHASSPERASDIFFRGTQYVTFALLPLAAVCLLFAREGLTLWFGREFADQAFVVAQILTVGSFVNCLALNPFSYLQAIGRPDITAKTHLLELPIYLVLLWVLTPRLGVIGVAIAWSSRMALDLIILLAVTARQSTAMGELTRRVVFRIAGATIALASLILIQSLATKAFVFLAIAAISAWALWSEWESGHITLIEAEH
jgi:O-antigen/teichoic acid export membrane protein